MSAVWLLVGLFIGGTAGLFGGVLIAMAGRSNDTAEAWVEEVDEDVHAVWCRSLFHADYECDCEDAA